MNEADARRRLAAQATDAERAELADVVIVNDGADGALPRASSMRSGRSTSPSAGGALMRSHASRGCCVGRLGRRASRRWRRAVPARTGVLAAAVLPAALPGADRRLGGSAPSEPVPGRGDHQRRVGLEAEQTSRRGRGRADAGDAVRPPRTWREAGTVDGEDSRRRSCQTRRSTSSTGPRTCAISWTATTRSRRRSRPTTQACATPTSGREGWRHPSRDRVPGDEALRADGDARARSATRASTRHASTLVGREAARESATGSASCRRSSRQAISRRRSPSSTAGCRRRVCATRRCSA